MVVGDGEVVEVVGLHGLGTLHEGPVRVGGDNGGGHDGVYGVSAGLRLGAMILSWMSVEVTMP